MCWKTIFHVGLGFFSSPSSHLYCSPPLASGAGRPLRSSVFTQMIRALPHVNAKYWLSPGPAIIETIVCLSWLSWLPRAMYIGTRAMMSL